MAQYDINYDDERFKNVETEKQTALNETTSAYNQMMENTNNVYNELRNQIDTTAQQQADIQNQQNQLAIEKIENEKADTQKNYEKEQRAAYVDWQRDINPDSAKNEAAIAQGLQNTSYSESAQINSWNTYQNRITTARDSMNTTMRDYNLGIKDAQLQNSSALAEIYANAATQKMEYTLQQFQYNNDLLKELTNKKQEINNTYYSRWQDVLSQINTENSLAESIRQYNENMAYQKERDAVQDAQWQKEYELSVSNSKKTSSGGSGGNNSKKKSKKVDTDKWGNDSTTQSQTDYYFKSTTGADYQPRYINNTKLTKTGVKLADIGTVDGISGTKNVWEAKGKYYVWDEDDYYEIDDSKMLKTLKSKLKK